MDELRPGDRVGRYAIEKRIGQRAMALLYLATDAELQRKIVIKLERDSPHGRSHLRNEGLVLAALQHTSILGVFDLGEHEDRTFLVLEHTDGGTLNDRLRKSDELPLPTAAEVIARVANALDYVHRRGYVHCNIKPRNILLDVGNEPRLSGFEFAVVQDKEKQEETLFGTAEYVSPERIVGDPLTPLADIWSLGVTLYESVTGRSPFHHDDKFRVLRDIVTTEAMPPSNLVPEVPSELDRICMRCLARSPNDRYPTAAALADDLERWARSTDPRPTRRVFISHATPDRTFVEEHIIAALEKQGVRTWYSKASIQTAAEWERSILNGLESCDWFLIALSSRSLRSEWVKDELHWAIDNRPQRIIPVLIDDCNLRDFHIRLSRIQYADLRTPSTEAQRTLMGLFDLE